MDRAEWVATNPGDRKKEKDHIRQALHPAEQKKRKEKKKKTT